MRARLASIIVSRLLIVTFCLTMTTFLRGQATQAIQIIQNKDVELGESGIRHRDVYVYVDEINFDREQIMDWTKKFSQKFPNPLILRITLFTDKEMLEKLMRFESKVWTVEFRDDADGRKAAAKFYEKVYPKPQGYFRVIYYRHGRSEYVQYSPDKDSPVMVRLDLDRLSTR